MVSAASMTPTASPGMHHAPQTGARLVSTDGLALPLQAAELEVDAKGGLARTVLTQTFVNPGSSPLHVQYLLPLPADGAVSGFSFKIADELVAGEVQTKQVAQERYTQALIEGRTAALVQQSRTSLFRQSVGNIPPHETVVAKIVVDQPLRWLEEAGAWQWRFPTVVAPRYQGAAGRVQDAAELAVDVSAEPLTVRMGLQLKIRDSLSEGARPSSSSHSLHVKTEGATLVRLADEGGVRLDRDVVVHWPVAAPQPGASLDVVRPAAAAHGGDAFGLLTLVPPAHSAGWGAVARDLVVLIDTSGSMGGEPLNQAKRVISALIDTLGDQDRLELISFDYAPTRFKKAPVSASPQAKREALSWLEGLSAGGGTEMHAAVQEALRPLRQGAQRQVVLVTDGYIGFEREIVHKVRTALPASCRLHTVGVGSSVNRSLTQAAARAGAGVEIIIAPTEDPERAAQRLVARTDRPVVTELVIEGEGLKGHAPVHLPDLFAGTPAQVSLRISGAGGQVRLRGRTQDGELVQSIAYPGMALGQGAGQIAVRYARERVFDLEAHKVGGGDAQEIDAQIEQLGLNFQIATDLTSWVAVSEKVRVDPAATAQTVNQPHEAPQHVSLAGVGLRPPALSLASSSGGAPMMERAAPSGFGGAARSRKAKKGRGMAPPPPAPRPASISEFVDEEDFDDDVSLAEEAEDGFSVEGAWQEVSADKAEVQREELAKDLVADPLPLKRAAAAKPAPRAQPEQASAAMPEPSEADLEDAALADEEALADEADLEDAGDAAQAASLPSQPATATPDDGPESLQAAPRAPLRAKSRRGKLWAVLVVLAAILGALWWFLRPHAAGEASSTEAPASSAAQSETTPPEAR